MQIEELFEIAKKARKNSYSPYSNYQVGACLVTKSGKIYTGCNIENNGIMSICAERVAFCKAISDGESEFETIYIVGGKKSSENLESCLPCGYCRQFMSEFVDDSFKIYYLTDNNNFTYSTIKDLLPNSFKI